MRFCVRVPLCPSVLISPDYNRVWYRVNLSSSNDIIWGQVIHSARYSFKSHANKFFLTLSQTSPGFYVSAVQVFWKHWGKQVFFTWLKSFMPFSTKLKSSSANFFNLDESKICRLGKGYLLLGGEKGTNDYRFHSYSKTSKQVDKMLAQPKMKAYQTTI